MTGGSLPRSTGVVRALAWSAAMGACLSGVLVLVGWVLDVGVLKSVAAGLPTVRPNTALALLLGGIALALRLSPGAPPGRRWLGVGLAVVMAVVGALSLLEELLGWGLTGADTLLLGLGGVSGVGTGWVRPSPLASICLVLLGPALVLLDRRSGPGLPWTDVLVVLALLGAMLGLNGVLLGPLVSSAPPFFSERSMALPTAGMLLLLGLGILCARPERGLMAHLTGDTPGGFVARRLVPVSVLGPPLLGLLLRVVSVDGILDPAEKLPLFATLVCAGGTALALLATRALDLLEAQRRRATGALESAEARFRELLEEAGDPMLLVDPDGRLRFVNAEAERVFGYRREELLGRELETLIPEGLFALPRQAHALAGMSVRSGRRKDGTEVPLEVSLRPAPSPGEHTLVAMLRDVSERERVFAGLERAREEAETQRTLLQTVLDHAPLGILFVDPMEDRLVANAVAEQLLGRPLNGAARSSYLAYLRQPDGQPVRPEELATTRAMRTGQAVRDQEFAVVRPDGRVFPMLATAAPVLGPAGKVRGVVVTVQDITARRDLERLREEYVSLISHDLRNPLHTINLRAHLLKRALRERRLEREVTMADAILHNVEWMNTMIEELLEGSRLESGRTLLHRAPCDLARFLEEVLERDVPPDVRERFRLEVAAPGPQVPVDVARLERVVTNLLSNALKYSPAGSPVVVRAATSNMQAVVSVSDQGPGLLAEDAARIFDKYYRTQGGRSADVKGLGLGLYISRLIIEAHGGHIWVESTPGQGATFRFSLPLEDAAQASPPGPGRDVSAG